MWDPRQGPHTLAMQCVPTRLAAGLTGVARVAPATQVHADLDVDVEREAAATEKSAGLDVSLYLHRFPPRIGGSGLRGCGRRASIVERNDIARWIRLTVGGR